MRLTLVSRMDRRSTFLTFNKATRLIAGPHTISRAIEANVYYFNAKFANFKPFVILSNASSVEMTGFEPVAFALQRRCSPAELHPRVSVRCLRVTCHVRDTGSLDTRTQISGPDWIRTSDPSLIRTVL